MIKYYIHKVHLLHNIIIYSRVSKSLYSVSGLVVRILQCMNKSIAGQEECLLQKYNVSKHAVPKAWIHPSFKSILHTSMLCHNNLLIKLTRGRSSYRREFGVRTSELSPMVWNGFSWNYTNKTYKHNQNLVQSSMS